MNEINQKYKHHENDTGSVEVQVVNMTQRINHLVEHFKSHKFDFSSKRGLSRLINRRKKFLSYIKSHNEQLYKKLIEDLGLRK